jgi:histone-lysine N-methyltransferase SETMAR
MMLTIVWNPSGFHLINILPKGFKLNASFYVTQILGRLSDSRRTQVGRTNRKLWVHADNARPHTATATLQFMQQNAMRRAPHPPYSPDLALSDFYLFNDIKQLLLECEFTDRDSLLQVVRDILGGIEKAPWKASFSTGWRDCTNLVQWVESMWSKERFYTSRISRNSLDHEMLIGGRDTLYHN